MGFRAEYQGESKDLQNCRLKSFPDGVHVDSTWIYGVHVKSIWGVSTLPLLFRVDSIGLWVTRIDFFLLFDPSIFLMIIHCLSGHFWLDHKVQWTFLTDFQWTWPMEVQWVFNGHSQQKSDRIPMDCKQAGLVISIINEKVHK